MVCVMVEMRGGGTVEGNLYELKLDHRAEVQMPRAVWTMMNILILMLRYLFPHQ